MKTRRKSQTVEVGKVPIGGDYPIVVQSMTDTDTADVDKTVDQCKLLADAGSEIVRVTVNNDVAAKAVSEIKKRLMDHGYDLPIVGDFHFIGHRLLSENKACAESLDKFRINPGNVGRSSRRDENFRRFIEIARDLGKAVRIGVNAGSLDQEMLGEKMDENARRAIPLSAEEVENAALVSSAVESAQDAEDIGLPGNKIVISCKVSRLPQMVEVNREIARRTAYPIHLGLTEAGMGRKAKVATSAALSILLYEGIGDTIRSSLTPAVGGNRADEVYLCQDVLQAIGARRFRPAVTACPGCGRTTSSFFRELAQDIQMHLDKKRSEWKVEYPGSEELQVAVMGCVVNGPGESKAAHIGISLPGSGEAPRAPVFVDGERRAFLSGGNIASDFLNMVESYVKEHWRETRY